MRKRTNRKLYFTAAKILSPQGVKIQSMSALLVATNAGNSFGSSLKINWKMIRDLLLVLKNDSKIEYLTNRLVTDKN